MKMPTDVFEALPKELDVIPDDLFEGSLSQDACAGHRVSAARPGSRHSTVLRRAAWHHMRRSRDAGDRPDRHRGQASERAIVAERPGPPCVLPLQLAPTSPTQDGRVGPCGALSMTAQCDRPNATCLSLASGWQHHGSRACSTRFRDTELLPALAPPAHALLRSQSGPRAAAWLGTVPSEAGATMPPDRMLIALRRLRLPLPVAPGRCGPKGRRMLVRLRVRQIIGWHYGGTGIWSSNRDRPVRGAPRRRYGANVPPHAWSPCALEDLVEAA